MHNECDGYGNCMAHAFPLIGEIHRPTNVHKTGRSGGMTKLMHLVNDKIRGVFYLIEVYILSIVHITYSRSYEIMSFKFKSNENCPKKKSLFIFSFTKGR